METDVGAYPDPQPAGAAELSIQSDWDFVPAPVSTLRRRGWVAQAFLCRSQALPAWHALRPIHHAAEGWIGYFIYAPQGQLLPHHRFTLHRLRALPRRLAVVLACPDRASVPLDQLAGVDALYWKALPGYDWSAYALLVAEVARASRGTALLLLNDSVLGPLGDLEALLPRLARWDAASLTSSNQIENHLQSYCLHFSAADEQAQASMAAVFPLRRCLSERLDVVLCQETRWARLASRGMRLGSLLHVAAVAKSDLTLQRPLMLLRSGLPFVKRSLLRQRLAPELRQQLQAVLAEHDHPTAGLAA